jgi:hypothetical protein
MLMQRHDLTSTTAGVYDDVFADTNGNGGRTADVAAAISTRPGRGRARPHRTSPQPAQFGHRRGSTRPKHGPIRSITALSPWAQRCAPVRIILGTSSYRG